MGFLADLGAGISGALGIGTSVANTVAQYKQMNYQKEMQQESWRREDNAVQRRVDDLGAAGLSPVLAAGSSAAASAPISIGAPDHGDIQGNIRGAQEMVAMQKSIAKTEADTLRTNAERAKVALESDKVDLQNKRIALDNEIVQRDFDIVKGDLVGKLYKRNSGFVSEFLEAVNTIADKFGYDGKVSIPGVVDAVKKVTGGSVVDSAKGAVESVKNKISDKFSDLLTEFGGDSETSKKFADYMAPYLAARPNMDEKEFNTHVQNFFDFLDKFKKDKVPGGGTGGAW